MFNRQSDATLQWFLPYCTIQKYPSQALLRGREQSSSQLGYLLEGCATLFIQGSDGKERILSHLTRGDFFGESELFQMDPVPGTWLRAKTACEVAYIEHLRFLKLVPMNPSLLVRLTEQLVRCGRTLAHRLNEHFFLDVTSRILHSLLTLAERPEAMTHPEGIQIKSTRQEIGQLAGCSRETAGRALKQLAAQDVLSAHGKTIILHHKNRMVGLTGFEPATPDTP